MTGRRGNVYEIKWFSVVIRSRIKQKQSNKGRSRNKMGNKEGKEKKNGF